MVQPVVWRAASASCAAAAWSSGNRWLMFTLTVPSITWPNSAALAAAHGFDHVIDYRSEDVPARVMEITGGAGADVAYDSVGKDTFAGTLASLRRHGTAVAFGQSSGPYSDFKIADLGKGSLHLTRPTLFHFATSRPWLEAASDTLFGLVGDGTLKVNINQRLSLIHI